MNGDEYSYPAFEVISNFKIDGLEYKKHEKVYSELLEKRVDKFLRFKLIKMNEEYPQKDRVRIFSGYPADNIFKCLKWIEE